MQGQQAANAASTSLPPPPVARCVGGKGDVALPQPRWPLAQLHSRAIRTTRSVKDAVVKSHTHTGTVKDAVVRDEEHSKRLLHPTACRTPHHAATQTTCPRQCPTHRLPRWPRYHPSLSPDFHILSLLFIYSLLYFCAFGCAPPTPTCCQASQVCLPLLAPQPPGLVLLLLRHVC